MCEIGHDGERGARAESRRRDAGGEAAAAREPLQGVADAGAVDAAGADAADGRGDSTAPSATRPWNS